MHARWLVLLVLLAVPTVAADSSSCGGSGNASTQVSPGSSSAAQQAPSTYKVGDLIKVGDGLMYSVTGVQAPFDSGNQFETPAKGQFMVVTVSLENKTSKTISVSSLISWELRDDSGQSYNETILSAAPKPPDGEIAPGDKLAGGLSYDVPKGKNFKLYFKNDIFSGGQVIVDLGQH
jgi:hypothetical protein